VAGREGRHAGLGATRLRPVLELLDAEERRLSALKGEAACGAEEAAAAQVDA